MFTPVVVHLIPMVSRDFWQSRSQETVLTLRTFPRARNWTLVQSALTMTCSRSCGATTGPSERSASDNPGGKLHTYFSRGNGRLSTGSRESLRCDRSEGLPQSVGCPLREPNLCEYAHVNSAPNRKIKAE